MDGNVKSFKRILKEAFEFPSKYEIGRKVFIEVDNQKIEGYIRTAIFTEGKVRYSVRTLKDNTTLHNLDSALISDHPEHEIIDMGFDNYS